MLAPIYQDNPIILLSNLVFTTFIHNKSTFYSGSTYAIHSSKFH